MLDLKAERKMVMKILSVEEMQSDLVQSVKTANQD